MTESQQATEDATENPNRFLAFFDWHRNRAAILVLAGGSLLVGLLVGAGVTALLSAATAEQIAGLAARTIPSLMTTVFTVGFTYFFINRYLRRRERESDRVMAMSVAQIEQLLDYINDALVDSDDDPGEDHAWLLEYKARPDSDKTVATIEDLRQILLSLSDLPSNYRMIASHIAGIRTLISRILSLLGIASPRVAAAIADDLELFSYRIRQIEENSSITATYEKLMSVYQIATTDEEVENRVLHPDLELLAVFVESASSDLREAQEWLRSEMLGNLEREMPDHFQRSYADEKKILQSLTDES